MTVLATKGAIALMERHAGCPRTALTVARALFPPETRLQSEPVTRLVAGTPLCVHFDPERSLAILVTRQAAFLGIEGALKESLIELATEFAVA
jgi:hypothetical protein